LTWLGVAGFPRGIESIEKVLNFKIGFQDLEKVLNFAIKRPLDIEKVWKFQMEKIRSVK